MRFFARRVSLSLSSSFALSRARVKPENAPCSRPLADEKDRKKREKARSEAEVEWIDQRKRSDERLALRNQKKILASNESLCLFRSLARCAL